ncbi:hypothetical protein RhiirA4_423315 [Rhizophagus irregularis]|uniref:Uncharacterized protein n=1 Tax=Rhizophagus irregularis TaxID=588596 RepID=A0A2I1GTM3_9GLOM|nr:hypothetical protein RhiirA4_421628 [Rhizophagus irregularis]PKY49905.1 hypothetical protein RhiirA4_423315 [Rhizophagus irregularis]
MDNNNSSHNNHKLTFTESNNLQSTDAVQPEQEYPPNIVATTSEFSMNDDNIFPTTQTSNTNNNYSDHQPTSNENTVSTSISQYYTSPYVPQYDHLQPIENTSSSFDSFNMTTINPSQSEIFSFDIPGFKIIIVPTFPQQDNTYSNYYSSLGTTDNQFTQFRQ